MYELDHLSYGPGRQREMTAGIADLVRGIVGSPRPQRRITAGHGRTTFSEISAKMAGSRSILTINQMSETA